MTFARLISTSLSMPTLRERATTAYAAQQARLDAESNAALENDMAALVVAARDRLEVIVTPFVHEGPEFREVRGRFVDTDGAEYVFALLDGSRAKPGPALFISVRCPSCKAPVWMGAWDDEALGVALCADVACESCDGKRPLVDDGGAG